MQIIELNTSELIPDPNNARTHDEKNLNAIKGSLAKFGQQYPIVIDDKNVVLSGNGRLEAAKDLGWKTIKVVRSDLKTETEKVGYKLADNQSAILADWDMDVLGSELHALREDGFEIEEIGFDPGDFKIGEEIDGVGFPDLPEGDKEDFRQITFTLHNDQADVVEQALESATSLGSYDGEINQNKNGNAIHRVCQSYLLKT